MKGNPHVALRPETNEARKRLIIIKRKKKKKKRNEKATTLDPWVSTLSGCEQQPHAGTDNQQQTFPFYIYTPSSSPR